MSAALEGREAAERALTRVLAAGAAQADASLREDQSVEVRVRGEEIDVVKQARERALGIRALVRGPGGYRSAVTSTSDLSPGAVDRMAEETAALARATAEDEAAGLPEDGFAGEAPDLALGDPADTSLSVEDRIECARRAEAAARESDSRIANSEGSEASSQFSHTVYANSQGFVGEYDAATHSIASMPIAVANGSMQTDWWLSVARRWRDLEEAASVGRRAAARALRRLGARPVPTCDVPVVFEAGVARSLLGHLAACLSGYAIYREASFLADRLGDRIAGEEITVVDDGRLPGGLGSRPFDGEGLPTGRKAVVERGRLASFLLDTYSGRKLSLRSTGNATRQVGSAPGAGPMNLWLEPGRQALEEIVASTERGLLVTYLFGLGFNPVTGDFSRGAAGLWIEGGEIAHPVEEVTVAGNLGDMLQGIDAVGDDLLWQGRVASPSLRIARLTVAGE